MSRAVQPVLVGAAIVLGVIWTLRTAPARVAPATQAFRPCDGKLETLRQAGWKSPFLSIYRCGSLLIVYTEGQGHRSVAVVQESAGAEVMP